MTHVIICLLLLLWAQIEIDTAPMGYQDHEGFHLGREPGE